ncbi:MAG: 50S ribosomal protein L35 [Lentisphaerae bacterium]|nr:MAG: 50S ribosomal protein L35 [Lentisphaerota bacterium]
MPKLKTRKSAAKRVKRTGSGKYLHWRRGRRHIMQKKNAKRRRRLRQVAEVKSTELNRIKACLPYGLD